MTLRVKNWKQFQHFKDRKPPWVKLYRDLLDDVEWYEMTGDDFKFLVGLWLLASESEGPDGELPPLKGIAFRLRVSERVARDRISRLNHWLVGSCEVLRQDDINVISKLRQAGPSETETEGELETETEGDGAGKPAPSAAKQRDDGFADFCKTFPLVWHLVAEPAGASAMLGDTLTPERRKAARTRWGEKHFRENWRAALEAIPRLPFYCGENDRHWRITPDYFLRPGSVVKVLERGTEPQMKGESWI